MELYAVQRENFDGLYVFASEHQRDRYAALFPEAEVGTVTVIDVDRGEAMIREEGGEALPAPESIRTLEARGQLEAVVAEWTASAEANDHEEPDNVQEIEDEGARLAYMECVNDVRKILDSL